MPWRFLLHHNGTIAQKHKTKIKKMRLHYERAYQQMNVGQFPKLRSTTARAGHVDRAHEIYLAGLKLHLSWSSANFGNLIRRDVNPLRFISRFCKKRSWLSQKILWSPKILLHCGVARELGISLAYHPTVVFRIC